jgi:hypothetical protein
MRTAISYLGVRPKNRLSIRLLLAILGAFVLLPGRLAAHATGLPSGSDHEQILSMFANTAYWTLVGVIAVVVMV